MAPAFNPTEAAFQAFMAPERRADTHGVSLRATPHIVLRP